MKLKEAWKNIDHKKLMNWALLPAVLLTAKYGFETGYIYELANQFGFLLGYLFGTWLLWYFIFLVINLVYNLFKGVS